jgi:hypothetical protein
MATDLTIFRVEVVDAGVTNKKSLNSKNTKSVKNSRYVTEDENDKKKQQLNLRKQKHIIKQRLADGTTEDADKDISRLNQIRKQQTTKLKSHISKVGTFGSQAASMYFQYTTTSYQLSGATYAAAKEQRKQQLANAGLQAGVSLLINPALLPLVLIQKLWTYFINNKKEMFDIKKSLYESNLNQRYLTKTVAERRF